MGGDFNTALLPLERVGVRCDMGSVRSFNNFILQVNLVDIPLHGMKFTWSNNRIREAWAILDRFLLSQSILLWFPNLVQRGLPRSLSDHNPIMIGDTSKMWGPPPFQFFNWWLGEKVAMKEGMQGWVTCQVSGTKSFVLFSKVKAAKSRLKIWHRSNKTILSKSELVENKLRFLDSKATGFSWWQIYGNAYVGRSNHGDKNLG
ncbi:hypothetical protein Ddye_018820 [Dipteronia dyeriana]|uniref:Endonuclease/exonuclease/phosphatase domain-containing protein n=1 Tax=Dipteronia dyeriana TaxID=168575 RepID=A0AAD9X1Q9_9ROSI|nr:hypothetical protein Ddye_018820 [Dipteronia dyeriana]